MKRLISVLTVCLLLSIGGSAQSIIEQFETETDNATSFSESGVSFTLTGEFHIENSGSNNYGVGPSSRYIDISNNCPASVGYKGSLYTGTKIIVDSIYVYPSVNCLSPSSSGTIIVQGYANGSFVDSVVVSSFPTYVYLSYESGFAKATDPFNGAAVDSIGFTTTGSLTYVAIDQFAFREAGTTWNGSTWDNGTPSASVDAIINSNTTPGSFTCQNLTINSGVALTMGSGNTANINGDVTNSGNGFSGEGTFNFAASGALSGNAISTVGVITVGSGATLTTNNLLTLSATSSSVYGMIGNSAGSISGNVTVERAFTGKRAFRFMGHPFTGTQALSALTDDIDITGTGGSSNGFTTTSTNNPSAYWYDVTAGDTTTTGANPGWTAFTHTNGSGANGWDQYELLRVLIRGDKGEGLTGGSYTPSAGTMDMTGTVNTGSQVVTLTKGSGTDFVACGNPFASDVQMNAVTKSGSIGSNYYVWDATMAASGAYVTNAFTTSYALPPFAAFFTTASSSGTITFDEADKTTGGSGLFKGTADKNWVELLINDSSTRWDRLMIHLDDNAMAVVDKDDAGKFYNPNLDFYTLSQDNKRLAIDVRPYSDGKSIPLGLTAYNRYNKYVIKVGNFDIPAGTKLMLHDKYLNKSVQLTGGVEYWFDVTSDTLSQGEKRFELNMVGKPATDINSVTNTTAKMQLIPNPAHNEVNVSFDNLDGEAQLKLTSITGQVVYSQTVNTVTGSVKVPLSNIPNGIYIVELQSNNARFTEKLIKE